MFYCFKQTDSPISNNMICDNWNIYKILEQNPSVKFRSVTDKNLWTKFWQFWWVKHFCWPPGMTEVARPIQLANQIKFGSRSSGSIEHERGYNFHSKQSKFSCWQTWKNSILHNQINVTQALKADFLSSQKLLATILFQKKLVEWYLQPWFWRQISIVKIVMRGNPP